MIICRDYNNDKRIDRVWYDSSNVIYSECIDHVNALKTLMVTFKNGATYKYSKVDVNDYLMFVNGGLDGSNGKALNKFIKSKYECERINDKDIEEINTEKEILLEKKSNKTQKETKS